MAQPASAESSGDATAPVAPRAAAIQACRWLVGTFALLLGAHLLQSWPW